MSTLVMKFGGTSVGKADAIRHVLNIVNTQRADWENVVVVTSAIRGVTDALATLMNIACAGDIGAVHSQIEDLRERHQQAARELIDTHQHPAEIRYVDTEIDSLLNVLRDTCEEALYTQVATARLRDAMLSMGERLMSRILAAIFRVNGISAEAVDASEVIITDSRFENAQPEEAPSLANVQRMILPLLSAGKIPVVTGYIGASADGQVTTFGRGGSDFSATYLARLLDADEAWIWTDVDGVMSADPRQIKEAQVIDRISYEEVSEFAHFGAKVLHPRAVQPIIEREIPLRVCNTFNASHAGTRIVHKQDDSPRYLRAVTSVQGVLVFVSGTAESTTMLTAVQATLSKEFSQEARPVITVDSHSGQLLCYVVPTTARRSAMQESVEKLHTLFSKQYADAGWRVEPIAIVAAIGVVEIKQTVQVLNAVKSVKADLVAMGHGSPECLLLAVPPNEALKVMRRLHRMIDSVQSQLYYEENNPATPAMPVNIPSGRRRRNKKNGRGRSSDPPHRVIPL
jgi:bifunctional aspartokinase / homoserine dehydrogenase 1